MKFRGRGKRWKRKVQRARKREEVRRAVAWLQEDIAQQIFEMLRRCDGPFIPSEPAPVLAPTGYLKIEGTVVV